MWRRLVNWLIAVGMELGVVPFNTRLLQDEPPKGGAH